MIEKNRSVCSNYKTIRTSTQYQQITYLHTPLSPNLNVVSWDDKHILYIFFMTFYYKYLH